MPQISVIVPIYKVEQYLDRCVQSIADQTFADIEIILVDDGSPDACPALCDAWAAKDDRVRVIHKPNGGLSDARNAGIAAAGSPFLAFVDGDDYIEPDMLRTLWTEQQRTGADIAVCSLRYVDEEGTPYRSPDFTAMPCEVLDEDGYWQRYMDADYHKVYYVVAWNKLYRAALFQTCRYPRGKIHEDEFVFVPLLRQCKTLACIGYIGYNYVQRAGSIMARKAERDTLDRWEVRLQRARYFAEKGWSIRAETALNEAIRALAGRDRFDLSAPAQKRRYRAACSEAAAVYRYMAGLTGQRSMLLRAALLRLGPKPYLAFLSVRQGRAATKAVLPAALRQQLTALQGEKRAFLLCQTPCHGNLGDQAIAMAERQFLADRFPDVPVVEIAEKQTAQYIEQILVFARDANASLLIHGGGFIGTHWPDQMELLLRTLETDRDLPVWILPQTVYFDGSAASQTMLDRMRAAIRGGQVKALCVREERAYARARELFADNVPVYHLPDSVLYFGLHKPVWGTEQMRTGIGLCLRRDRESCFTPAQRMACKAAVRQAFPGEPLCWTDTVRPETFSETTRAVAVTDKLREFAGYRLLVTDRLHGMVFAALTGTPCLVLDNSDGKVMGVYAWIRQNAYVRPVPDPESLPAALQVIQPYMQRQNVYDPGDTMAGFAALERLLQKIM